MPGLITSSMLNPLAGHPPHAGGGSVWILASGSCGSGLPFMGLIYPKSEWINIAGQVW